MSTNNVIPSVWHAALIDVLHKSHVYGQEGVINRNYEGDIQDFGDSVKINMIGPITIGTYTKNNDMTAPQALEDAGVTLVIDQQKFFHFQIDDVDRAQQIPKLRDSAMGEAAYATSDDSDQYLASVMAAGVSSTNTLNSGNAVTDLGTAGYPYNYLVALGVKLDEANVPSQGRWAVVPPFFHGLLLQDTKFVGYGTPPQDARLRNGAIGECAGFTILKSNNVPNTNGASYKIIAGTDLATTYADQIIKIEAYRIPLRFADAMKGLHVYGAKVVRPSALAMLIANRPAGI